MDASHPIGSIPTCRQCLHYSDLLGRELAYLWLIDSRALDALAQEISKDDIACSCAILRGWGIWFGEPETSLSHSDVWLRELPARSIALRFKRKDGERAFEVLCSMRPDLRYLGKRWNLCWCSGSKVCAVHSAVCDEEDDTPSGSEIEWPVAGILDDV